MGCFGKRRKTKLTHAVPSKNPNNPKDLNSFELRGYSKIVKWKAGSKTGWVFRQALLLRQTSAESIGILSDAQNLRASLEANDGAGGRDYVVLKLTAGVGDSYASTAKVLCSMAKNLQVDYLKLTPFAEETLPSVAHWLDDCECNHGSSCGKLNWSNRNPSRLLEILSPSELRLVEGTTLPERTLYMALSYVWGDKSTSNTIASNLAQRKRSFPTSNLLRTQQDAVELARRVGMKFVWIDAICIIQDSGADWAHEATLMHEYYGNARFTLYISSGKHADEGFLGYRDAWKYRQLDCDIGGVRLLNIDAPLDEARTMSPHATRAWTLQEEYLSPRRVYWFRSRLYWSCAAVVRDEGISEDVRRPGERPRVSEDAMLLGRFLLAAFQHRRTELHEIWLGVVESYARRNLTQPGDKFKAIAGLASRYWTEHDQYLAGLWAQTFAGELAWKLDRAMSKSIAPIPSNHSRLKPQYVVAPSWSWASLVAQGELQFLRDFVDADDFALVEHPVFRGLEESTKEADTHVEHGSLVKQVRVEGRLRRFWDAEAKLVSWDEVSLKEGPISFDAYRSADAYSVDLKTGLLAMAERRTEEIVGQLDYIEDAQAIFEGCMVVECLGVGEGAMLLVCRVDSEGTIYRRVGACHKMREDFFRGKPCKEILLV